MSAVTLDRSVTAMLSGTVAAALMVNAAFYEAFTSPRLFVVLALLLLLHLLRSPVVLFCREFAMYAVFLAYMLLSLLWAPDPALGANTLVPAVNFLLILILLGSLVAFHDLSAVLTGLLGGVLLGAGLYTYVAGFPFKYPQDFSYNAIAAMYLFGLFCALLFGWGTRWRIFSLSIAALLLIHIAATTSIKANLGVLVGVVGAGIIYRRQFSKFLRRNAVLLVVVSGAFAYAVASNNAVAERFQAGIERVEVGLKVLQARDDVVGYRGYEQRSYWEAVGLRGWAGNPIFGNGVEAFRADHGTTSHSTPIDLLYNFGLIGLGFFYAIFVSLAWRLSDARGTEALDLRALVAAGLICELFIALSGTLFYLALLAAFLAISIALLRRLHRQELSLA